MSRKFFFYGSATSNLPYTQDFITFYGISDATIIAAFNEWERIATEGSLINYATPASNRILARWQFAGGTDVLHGGNFLAPGTFTILWGGGVTHNSNGITGNGSSGFGDTQLIPSAHLSLNSAGVSYYCRTNSATTTYEAGCLHTDGSSRFEVITRSAGNAIFPLLNTTSTGAIANANSNKRISIQRTGVNTTTSYRDAVSIGVVPHPSTLLPNRACYVLARNVGVAQLFTAKNLASFEINKGLTAAEETIANNAEVAYQTLMGRNV